jgi:hypothetical protein
MSSASTSSMLMFLKRLCGGCARSGSDGQIGRLNLFAAAEQHGALDGVLQFAHVARPRILHHLLHGGRREADDLLAIAGAVAVEKVLGQQAECLRGGRAARADEFRRC